jgi:HK97 gp10 family phage protein
MAFKGTSFNPKYVDAVSKISDKLRGEFENQSKSLNKKMQSATNIIWTTATARRPMITNAVAKAQGRGKTKNGKLKRVSNPDASAGVPVASGELQISIKKEITMKDGKATGRVYTNNSNSKVPHHIFIEFGTSKMPARPFMRPALNVNMDKVRRIFRGQ